MKVLNDPVTVFGEYFFKMPLRKREGEEVRLSHKSGNLHDIIDAELPSKVIVFRLSVCQIINLKKRVRTAF